MNYFKTFPHFNVNFEPIFTLFYGRKNIAVEINNPDTCHEINNKDVVYSYYYYVV